MKGNCGHSPDDELEDRELETRLSENAAGDPKPESCKTVNISVCAFS